MSVSTPHCVAERINRVIAPGKVEREFLWQLDLRGARIFAKLARRIGVVHRLLLELQLYAHGCVRRDRESAIDHLRRCTQRDVPPESRASEEAERRIRRGGGN